MYKLIRIPHIFTHGPVRHSSSTNWNKTWSIQWMSKSVPSTPIQGYSYCTTSNIPNDSSQQQVPPFVSMVNSLANRTITANGSPAFRSTLDARLDFFYKVSGDTPSIHSLLSNSWNQNPLDTMKLIFHLRDIRNGKSDRNNFYYCQDWLTAHHPKTQLANLSFLPKVGYWKDLLELISRSILKPGNNPTLVKTRKSYSEKQAKKQAKKQRREARKRMTEEQRKADRENIEVTQRQSLENTTKKRHQIREERNGVASLEYERNPHYRQLVDAVADMFAEQLKKDMVRMEQKKRVGLCAKWAPSPYGHHDKHTQIAFHIAKRIYGEEYPKSSEESEEDYRFRITYMYRSYMIAPLRRYSLVTEVFMSANEWNLINYKRVASVCMNNNRDRFRQRDTERFEEFLQKVAKGEVKIASGALKPYQLTSKAMKDNDIVLDLQWKELVERTRSRGTLSNCLAICDVSGSMTVQVSGSATALDVAISLSLLLSEISEHPWKGIFCTFSQKPQFHKIVGATLHEKVNNISQASWGMNTDFQAVFEMILFTATLNKLKPEDMVKKVFVFSDMQFDAACSVNTWSTDHEILKQKFMTAGYPMPAIVYWNIHGDITCPVTSDESGTALVSGFSGNLLNIIMDGDPQPIKILEQILNNTRYSGVTVVD